MWEEWGDAQVLQIFKILSFPSALTPLLRPQAAPGHAGNPGLGSGPGCWVGGRRGQPPPFPFLPTLA